MAGLQNPFSFRAHLLSRPVSFPQELAGRGDEGKENCRTPFQVTDNEKNLLAVLELAVMKQQRGKK